jgi:hypothetical protein
MNNLSPFKLLISTAAGTLNVRSQRSELEIVFGHQILKIGHAFVYEDLNFEFYLFRALPRFVAIEK